MAFRNRAYRQALAQLFDCALIALLVLGPWYAWLAGTLGKDTILHSTPVSLGDSSATFHPKEIAKWIGFNVGASVVPVGIGEAFLKSVPADGEAPPRSIEVSHDDPRWFVGPPDLVELHRGVTQLYFSLLTGTVTISLTAFLIVAALRRLRHGPAPPSGEGKSASWADWSAVWLFLIGGTLGGAFLHPGKIPWGIAHSAVFPTAVVLAALAWGLLSRASRRTALVVCCGMALEFVLMFWSHLWLLFHDPNVLEPGNTPETYREDVVRLLNECLASGAWVFLAGAILIEAALFVLLVLFLRRTGKPT